MRRIDRVLFLMLLALPALSIKPISAQNADAPKFDAVSVTTCAPGEGPVNSNQAILRGVETSPGRLHVTCLSVVELMNAYSRIGDERLVNDSAQIYDSERVREGPAWARSDRYTIDAKTTDPLVGESGPQASDLLRGSMLRTLLEDHFQLQTHHHTEAVPTYSLTIAKRGLKLTPMEQDGCTPMDPIKPGPPISDVFSGAQKPLCASWATVLKSDWAIILGGKTLSDFASVLTSVMGRPVEDKTGVNGAFNVLIEFAHDESAPGNAPPPGIPSTREQTEITSGPSVFNVLEEQLGLKLVPDKGPREYLVIDSVQRPREN